MSLVAARRAPTSTCFYVTSHQVSNLLVPSHGLRPFHTSHPHRSNPFFHLAGLSNARETQHFAKASGLSHVEHSPNLQLIRSSEVKPFEKTLKTTVGSAGPSFGKNQSQAFSQSASASTAAAATDAVGWSGWGPAARTEPFAEPSVERIARYEASVKKLQKMSEKEQEQRAELMRDIKADKKSGRRSPFVSFASFLLGCVATTVLFPAILDVYGLELTRKAPVEAPAEGPNLLKARQHEEEAFEAVGAASAAQVETMSAAELQPFEAASMPVVAEDIQAVPSLLSDASQDHSTASAGSSLYPTPKVKKGGWQSFFWSED